MTENKFGVITNWCVYENVDGVKKWMNFDEVVDLLNDLSNENKQLKEQNRQLRLENGRLTHDLFWANKKIKEELE